MTTMYVSGDAAAVSVGADAIAVRLAHIAPESTIIRNGSRGMLWLEPLVEIQTAEGRVGFGPVKVEDIDAILTQGTSHPLCIGLVDQHPWLVQQQRITFARVGIIDPLSPEDFRSRGGLRGLEIAAGLAPEAIVDAVLASGLRGRGGAGFPAGIKWRTVANAQSDQKYICCNADEGDSGTFADRMLIEGDPFTLIEGMAIAALATGADTGYVYLRSEYPHAIAALRSAIAIAEREGWIGESILGTGKPFWLEVRVGAGSYVCGEETAMLESLEGKRGVVRAKPPIPALEGLYGKPTVVNNVLTLASVPMVLADGPESYEQLGQGRSRGTQVFQLGGNIAQGGIVELAFGVTLRELIEQYGQGTATGRPVRAVQVGGPLGAYLSTEQFDVQMDYEELLAIGGMLGHGGIVVFDDTVDMAEQARFAFEFCAEESCGKCTPCRIGSTRGREVMDRVLAGIDTTRNLGIIEDLCDVMTDGSLCAMGGLTPMPVRSAMMHFGEDFVNRTPDGKVQR